MNKRAMRERAMGGRVKRGAAKGEVSFTDRELDVMAILWELGSGTVTEVRERLPDELAYTTVLTVLRTLEAKGHISYREDGRAHRYYPLVEREVAGESALRRMVRKLFRGSPELLLTQLVADRGLTDADVRRLREVLDERLEEEPEGETGRSSSGESGRDS